MLYVLQIHIFNVLNRTHMFIYELGNIYFSNTTIDLDTTT